MVDAAAARKIEPKATETAADTEDARPKEMVVELRKPVQAFGTTLTQLTFRRPTGADIMALGDAYPFSYDLATNETKPVPGPMGRIMSTLAQVPLSTIQSMDADDFSFCSLSLLYRFFIR